MDEAWEEARARMAAAEARDYPADYPSTLDAAIRIVDGREVIADNAESEEAMCARFESWIGERYFGAAARGG
jgi:hypothetical protein